MQYYPLFLSQITVLLPISVCLGIGCSGLGGKGWFKFWLGFFFQNYYGQ